MVGMLAQEFQIVLEISLFLFEVPLMELRAEAAVGCRE